MAPSVSSQRIRVGAPPDRRRRTLDGPDSAAWGRLVREIEACERCALSRSRTHVVIYRGGPRPRVVFVGEAPGSEEDRLGRPFVGRSGRRLDAALGAAGLTPGEYGILNLIKCRPPRNRFDRKAAVACRPFLERQLALLGPERLVSLGAHALQALDPSAPPVSEASGVPRSALGRPLYPLLHPAAAIHAPRRAARWAADVVGLRDWLRRPSAQTL